MNDTSSTEDRLRSEIEDLKRQLESAKHPGRRLPTAGRRPARWC